MKKNYYLMKYKCTLLNRYRVWKRKRTVESNRIMEYPVVIQMPITHLCNFDCVMCGMRKMINRWDFSPEDIRNILSDKLFKEVRYVGINGGEPFLRNDIVECTQAVLDMLPQIQEINFISNGYFTDKIKDDLKKIRELCSKKNVRNSISISVDGINEMQDFHRGHKDSFINADKTISELKNDLNNYADSINVICTITRYNISRINEVELWSKQMGIDVAYNIATENVRIENEDKVKDFSVFSDEISRMLTEEFFYKKYSETLSERYFSIYLFLKYKKRFDTCPCMFNQWITITPDGELGFCATHSKKLGSGIEESSYDIVKRNLNYLDEIKKNYCNRCSHYMYELNDEGLRLMLEDQYKNTFFKG